MQLFSKSLNKLPVIAGLIGALVGPPVIFGVWYYVTPKNFQVGYAPTQPVPYSHRLHVGQMGMDCRYCHTNVEKSAKAMIPPTQTCMGCHSMIRTDSAKLAPVRKSWETGKPVEWVHIHKLADHVYFNHSVHVAVGVGCNTCHGRIDRMEVVRADQPLSMGWCLECHRDYKANLRPKGEVTNMNWTPDMAAGWTPPDNLNPPQHCSGCHR